jgi:hypothetical protein
VKQAMESFLVSLSDAYEREERTVEEEIEQMVTSTNRFFQEVQVRKLSEQINNEVESGHFRRALDCITGFTPLGDMDQPLVDLMREEEIVHSALSHSRKEPLIEYPEGLGMFFQDTLRAGNFISFMGPNKSGKSFFLLDLAYRAALQRRRTLYLEAGDLTQNQLVIRFLERICRRPRKAQTIVHPRELIPVGSGMVRLISDEMDFHEPLDFKYAWAKCQDVLEHKMRTRGSFLKLQCHSNSTLKVEHVRALLQKCQATEWPVEVLIIDYADIMSMPSQFQQARDQNNELWKRLRAISQEFNLLLVTATQCDTDGFNAPVLTRKNFSEDRRKLDHVTGMIGINAAPAEKKEGLCRLNWVSTRDLPYDDHRCVHVAGCLSIANPAIRSAF